jgi:hypothetical protein
MPEAIPKTVRAFPALITNGPTDLAIELELPASSENLFQRIIRNPRPESDQPKERECTEMFCAILQNAPALRNSVLCWMADKVRLNLPNPENLRFVFDTEQSTVGAKRDDLRIVALSEHEQCPVFTWSVEVKVGASFHHSTEEFGDELKGSNEKEALPVNQLVNYNRWLKGCLTQHRAGFVLSLYDRKNDLPSSLDCPWECLTWTGLAEVIVQALRKDTLPQPERFLAKHVLGFIRTHLWRASEMSEASLDFNDVALIRAFAVLAKDCEQKVNRLVAPLGDVIKKAGIGKGQVRHTKSLFGGIPYSGVHRHLGGKSSIYAGIGGDPDSSADYLSVWIQTPPNNARKPAIKKALAKIEPRLKKRNSDWLLPSQENDSGDAAWGDVELSVPLTVLLVEEDQEKAVRDFCRKALNDLKESGILTAFDFTTGKRKK